jgi:hypothetical protein
VVGERHIERLIATGVFKQYLQDGVRMISNRQQTVGREEGQNHSKRVEKVSFFCLLYDCVCASVFSIVVYI